MLLAGSSRSPIGLWDARDRQWTGSLEGHTARVGSICLISHQLLATGSADRNIIVWNLEEKSVICKLTGHQGAIEALVALPDGLLLSGSYDKTIRVWDWSNKVCRQVLEGHTKGVNCLQALPPDRFASGSDDHTVRLWSLGASSSNTVIANHRGPVNALLALPEGRLASGSGDSRIHVLDIKEQKLLSTLTGHSAAVRALVLVMSMRLPLMLSGSDDGTIRVWCLSSYDCLAMLRSVHDAPIKGLAYSPDSNGLVSSSDLHGLEFWPSFSLRSLDLRHRLHFGEFFEYAFSDDGSQLHIDHKASSQANNLPLAKIAHSLHHSLSTVAASLVQSTQWKPNKLAFSLLLRPDPHFLPSYQQLVAAFFLPSSAP